MICPRCAHQPCDTVAHSPQAGCWSIYLCPTCYYSWRSSEPITHTDRPHYPSAFRLTAADIEQASELPIIPPLSADKS